MPNNRNRFHTLPLPLILFLTIAALLTPAFPDSTATTTAEKAVIAAPALVPAPPPPASSGLRVDLDVGFTGGYFLLPQQITGNVVNDNYYNYSMGDVAPYRSEAAGSGYEQDRINYSHPFPKTTRRNLGVDFGLLAYVSGNFGVGVEFSHLVSYREQMINHTYANRLASPARFGDYALQLITSEDRFYTKLTTYGIKLGCDRMPLARKITWNAGLGIGMADLLEVMKVEILDSRLVYYQNNGNVVLTDSSGTYSTFQVIGINYSSLYLRPWAGVQYALGHNLALNLQASLPVMILVDNGYKWGEGSTYDRNVIFYPDERFFAGNLQLTAGIRMMFGLKKAER